MNEQLPRPTVPDSIINNYALQEQESGLIVAESKMNHRYERDEHPHQAPEESESQAEGHVKTRGIAYTETKLEGKPFVVAERPSDNKVSESADHHDDSTDENLAELSPFELFDQYIDAEISDNQTFIEDYSNVLAEKLGDVTELELADLLAEAEDDGEVSGADVSRTIGLLNDAIDEKVKAFHASNSKLPYADALAEGFRMRIEREKEEYLAVLREKRVRRLESENAQQASTEQTSVGDEEKKQNEGNVVDDLDDYMPGFVRVNSGENDGASGQPDEEEPSQPEHEEADAPVTDETAVLPQGDESQQSEDIEDDELFDGEPQADEQPAKRRRVRDSATFAKFKEGVRRHLREYPIKDTPPKPEGYEHPLDKFDRLYTFPAKARINRKAAEVRGSVKASAEKTAERHAFFRKVSYVGQVAIGRVVALPQQWDLYLQQMDEDARSRDKDE